MQREERLKCAGKEMVGFGRNVRRKLTSTINETRPDLSMGKLLIGSVSSQILVED